MRLLAGLALVALLALPACGAVADDEPPLDAQEDAAPLPDLARIVCRPGQPPLLETQAVRPRADGVHLELVNETGEELAFSVMDASGGGQGGGASTGTSAHVVGVPPGTATVACYGRLEDGGEVERTPLDVVDEDGVWVPATLACGKQFSSVIDYAVGARGDTSDRVVAARSALEPYGLEPGDLVERAGYPDAEEQRVRLVRGGKPVAVVYLVEDGGGKWLVGGVTGCSSLSDGRE